MLQFLVATTGFIQGFAITSRQQDAISGQVRTPESFEGAKLADTLFFSAGTFGKIALRRTQLSDREKESIAKFSNGRIAEFDKLNLESQSETQAFTTRFIGEVILKEVTQNGYDITGTRLKPLVIKR